MKSRMGRKRRSSDVRHSRLWAIDRLWNALAAVVVLGVLFVACGGGTIEQPSGTNDGIRGFVGEATSVPATAEPVATRAPTAEPQPTAVPAPTAKPAPTALPAPTAKPPIVTPEPTEKPLSVKKVSLTGSVRAGGTAKVTIKTEARAECSIEVEYNSGPSTAAGLDDKTANSSGGVTWTWKVGTNTASGSYPIEIWCSKGDREEYLSLTFKVT